MRLPEDRASTVDGRSTHMHPARTADAVEDLRCKHVPVQRAWGRVGEGALLPPDGSWTGDGRMRGANFGQGSSGPMPSWPVIWAISSLGHHQGQVESGWPAEMAERTNTEHVPSEMRWVHAVLGVECVQCSCGLR